MRGRGSKLDDQRDVMPSRLVAPHAGARIETVPEDTFATREECRPPCGGADRNLHTAALIGRLGSRPPCGGADRNNTPVGASPLSQSRPPCGGADRNIASLASAILTPVAPHAGARIETPSHVPPGKHHVRRPPCGGADRNDVGTQAFRDATRRPPCGGADRNVAIDRAVVAAGCRPPCGGADRNVHLVVMRRRKRLSPPMRGRGSKHQPSRASYQ